METIVYIAVAFIVIWNLGLWWAQKRIEREILEDEIEAELKRRIPVLLNIDEINGMVYGWDHRTNDFVCQGRDMAEFRNNFQLRFPDRNAAIMEGPEELMARMKQEMNVIKQNENLSSQ